MGMTTNKVNEIARTMLPDPSVVSDEEDSTETASDIVDYWTIDTEVRAKQLVANRDYLVAAVARLIEDHRAADMAKRIEKAKDYIDAIELPDGRYAYCDSETRTWYATDREAMVLLSQLIENVGRRDAYDIWLTKGRREQEMPECWAPFEKSESSEKATTESKETTRDICAYCGHDTTFARNGWNCGWCGGN